MRSQGIAGAVAAAALLVCAAAVAQTTVYRWVDKDGNVHFSDTPPPKDAKDASQKRLGGGGPEEGAPPFATQEAMKRNPVSIFVSDDCGDPCAQGRELLSRRGVPFADRNAQQNREDGEALRQLVGDPFVPVLQVGEGKYKGFNEEGWHKLLDAAGYPRTKLPSQRTPAVPPPAANPGTAAPR